MSRGRGRGAARARGRARGRGGRAPALKRKRSPVRSEVEESSEAEDGGVEIEQPADSTVLTITQFPGQWGSFAGDCAVVETPTHFWIIDLGTTKTFDTKLQPVKRALALAKELKARGKTGSLIITHFHDDHTAGGAELTKLNALFSKLYYGSTTTDVGTTALAARFERAFSNGKLKKLTVASTVNKIQDEDTGSCTIGVSILTPAHVVNPSENCMSLGVLFTLTPNGATQPTFSFLSLGDMTPNAADAVVAKVQTVLAGGAKEQKQQKKKGKVEPKTVSLLKFPHHGSESNYIPSLDHLVGDTTQVIISGYTGTVPTSLQRLHKKNPSGISILTTKTRHDAFKNSAPASYNIVTAECGVAFKGTFTGTVKLSGATEYSYLASWS